MKLLLAICFASAGCGFSLSIHDESQYLLNHLASDIARIRASLKPWQSLLAEDGTGQSFLQRGSDPGVDAAASSLPGIEDLMVSMEKDWKAKIVAANRAEKEEKAWYTETIHGLDPKREAWDPQNGKNTYQMIEGYWTKHRALEHRQYHNLLKIAHAGIDRFRSVIHAVEAAKAGKSPDKDSAKLLNLDVPAPTVVLVTIGSKLHSLDTWAKEAAQQLEALRAELSTHH
eukprot:gnl/MRDRNA2_/MRDRNA2_91584_c0_seq1.p1 gnl/MRDRNA2_/MRDRNA2_91584_c0~~gnl/MRDRNA2_/MRDRNA2_91584_c0_seq1.p1  ORF type:complete len:229 (+),score=58.32 gnl/MRDRNA2_/MRDRNA2_91584_c0_seq1:146-832(+)